MALKARAAEEHIERVLAEVEAGQESAGATVSDSDRRFARSQLLGDISGDEAARAAILEALENFDNK